MTETAPTFTRERPNPLLKLGLKLPSKLYWGPLATFMSSRCVMLLTTTGRKSGLPRTGAISFHPMEDGYFGLSGFGVESQWYQNVLANPKVTLQIGKETIEANATVVEDPERRRELIMHIKERSAGCGPPAFIRPVLSGLRLFDYDGDVQMAVDNAETFPVVEFRPEG